MVTSKQPVHIHAGHNNNSRIYFDNLTWHRRTICPWNLFVSFFSLLKDVFIIYFSFFFEWVRNIDGALYCAGTADQPILFTSLNSTATWGGISIRKYVQHSTSPLLSLFSSLMQILMNFMQYATDFFAL